MSIEINNTTLTEIVANGVNVNSCQMDDQIVWKKKFEVKFLNWDGMVLDSQLVAFEEDAVVLTEPSRPQNEKFYFLFAGWDLSFEKVQSNLTVTAMFSVHERTFEVVWKDGFGGIVRTDSNMSYGAELVVPTTTKTGYKFSGWDKPVVAVSADTVYTAQWIAMTWTKVWSGKTQLVFFGEQSAISFAPRGDGTSPARLIWGGYHSIVGVLIDNYGVPQAEVTDVVKPSPIALTTNGVTELNEVTTSVRVTARDFCVGGVRKVTIETQDLTSAYYSYYLDQSNVEFVGVEEFF